MANSLPKRIKVDPPSEIVFTGPFDRMVASSLKLTNTTSEKVCFKIKTTAPKAYSVKPSFGFVEPEQQTNVEILLQPSVENNVERSKHKFMIQSLIAPPDEKDLDKIWKEASQNDIQDSKLRCIMKLGDDIVKISPTSELEFSGNPCEASVKLKSVSDCAIAFKVSSTAPEKFVIKSPSGILQPYEEVVVPCTYVGSYNNESSRDKLLFSVVPCPGHQEYSDKLWKQFYEKKLDYILRCTYKQADGVKASGVDANKGPQKASLMKDEEMYKRKLLTQNVQNSPKYMSPTQQNNQTFLSMLPPIGYLILCFIIGILCGRFLL